MVSSKSLLRKSLKASIYYPNVTLGQEWKTYFWKKIINESLTSFPTLWEEQIVISMMSLLASVYQKKM